MNEYNEIREILREITLSQKQSEKEMKELRESQKETQKESEKEMKELRESQKETDRIIRETQKESEKEMKELRESQKETDRIIRESQKETDRLIKETNKQISGLGKTKADVLEYSFFTALRHTLSLDTIQYNTIYTKLKSKYKIKNQTYQQEFDIVLENGKTIAIIEVKSKPDLDDLYGLTRIKNTYKLCFPDDINKEIKIYLGSSNYDDTIVDKAKKKLIPLLSLKNQIVTVLKANNKIFKLSKRKNSD